MNNQDPQQARPGMKRRFPPYTMKRRMFALLTSTLLLIVSCTQENPTPPLNPNPPSGGERAYPYSLVPGNPVFDFPAAEGRLPDMDNDTWFLEGILEGKESRRRFSFIVVYFVSRIYGVIPFNFYSLTFYDLDNAEYGTFTSYDMWRMKASTGYLNLSYPVEGENATWTTTIGAGGHLVPYSYRVNLRGKDQEGRKMGFVSAVEALNPPVPVGADTYNGQITVLKQPDTFSYFQTGLQFDGVLTWGDYSEPVRGSIGHIDRQMFPEFSGVKSRKWDARDLSHEWRTYFLENGMDFSSWRQFDRMDRNSTYSYGGATIYSPTDGDRYINDIIYENQSYVRTENHPVKPLLPARSEVLYFPNRHRLTSESLDLDLEVEPLVIAPLLAFPVEYMHGPALLSGSLAGEPIKGIGSFELTLHLYRDFELVNVLYDSVKHLPAEAILHSTAPFGNILDSITQVKNAVDNNEPSVAHAIAGGQVRNQLQTLAEPFRAEMLQILDDLIAVI